MKKYLNQSAKKYFNTSKNIMTTILLSSAALEEPHTHVKRAVTLLQNETNEALPEGQLRLQAVDTLAQLEGFMKTVGCQM